MTYEIRLTSPQQAKVAWNDIFPKIHDYLQNNGILTLTIKKKGRSNEQNRLMWVALGHLSNQVVWHGQKLTKEEWKDVLTACWNGEMRMAAFDGKVIMLPQRTSKMGKRVFSEWMEYLVAMAAQSGVEPVYVSGPKHDQR